MTTLTELTDRRRQRATDIDAILRKDKAKLERQRRKAKKAGLDAEDLAEKLKYLRQVKEIDQHLRQWHLSYYENYDRLEAEECY